MVTSSCEIDFILLNLNLSAFGHIKHVFRHGCKSLNTVPPAILVAGPAGCGKTTLIIGVARRLGVHAFKVYTCNLSQKTLS